MFLHEGFQKFCSLLWCSRSGCRELSQTIFLSLVFASAHGIVSSMYLLQRLNSTKISVIVICDTQFFPSSHRLSRVSSVTALGKICIDSLFFFCLWQHPLSLLPTPPKYLFVMEIVLFTRFPSVFGKVRVHTLYHQLPMRLHHHFQMASVKYEVTYCIYS